MQFESLYTVGVLNPVQVWVLSDAHASQLGAHAVHSSLQRTQVWHQHVNGRCAPWPAQRNTGVMKNKSVQKYFVWFIHRPHQQDAFFDAGFKSSYKTFESLWCASSSFSYKYAFLLLSSCSKRRPYLYQNITSANTDQLASNLAKPCAILICILKE